MLARYTPLAFALAVIAVSSSLAGAQATSAASVPMKEEKPGLLKQATVTPDSARRMALALVPTGRIKSEEIEVEDGRLAYSFDITVPGKRGVEEILIDARTGVVISHEHESPQKEAAEARREPTTPRHTGQHATPAKHPDAR